MTDSDDKDTRKPRTSSPFKQGGVNNRLPRRRSVPAFMKKSAQDTKEQSTNGKTSQLGKSQEGRKKGSERPAEPKTTTTPRKSSNSSTGRSGASDAGRAQSRQRKQSGAGNKPVESSNKAQRGGTTKPVRGRKPEETSGDSPFKFSKQGSNRSVQQQKPVSLPSPGAVSSEKTGSGKAVDTEKSSVSGVKNRGAGRESGTSADSTRGKSSGKQGSQLPSLKTESSPVTDSTVSGDSVESRVKESESIQDEASRTVDSGLPSLDDTPDVDDDTGSVESSDSALEQSFESFLAELSDDESPVSGGVSSDVDGDDWLYDDEQGAGVAESTGQQGRNEKTFADHYVGDKKRSKKSGYDKRKIVEKYAKKNVSPKSRERYKHFTEHNKVTGRQIEFFQNLNLAHTYDKHVMADLLKPPVDMTAETREQKALRERLVRQALGGEEALKRGSRLRVSPKDIEVMRFLARFQYATARHVSRIYAETEGASQRRLNRLRERGLVLSNYFYGAKTIYWLTEEGMLLSGYDYKVLHQQKDINLQSFPHRFGLNHLAANIMGANVNVLDLDDFPQKNRESLVDGSMVEGETLVSEYEIHSTLARKRGSMRGEIYKPQIISENRVALRDWAKRKRDGLSDAENPSPEFLHGNEFMFALYPKNVPELVHHIPDLVVKRPRDPRTGAPRSIAVELELNVKRDKESYKRTMLAYKSEDTMLKEVVWVSPEKDIRTVLERAADDVGLTETGRVRILPLYVEDGIFVNMNMWQL